MEISLINAGLWGNACNTSVPVARYNSPHTFFSIHVSRRTLPINIPVYAGIPFTVDGVQERVLIRELLRSLTF